MSKKKLDNKEEISLLKDIIKKLQKKLDNLPGRGIQQNLLRNQIQGREVIIKILSKKR